MNQLTSTQQLVFDKIIETGVISAKDLAETTGVARRTTFDILRKLSQAGRVERVGDLYKAMTEGTTYAPAGELVAVEPSEPASPVLNSIAQSLSDYGLLSYVDEAFVFELAHYRQDLCDTFDLGIESLVKVLGSLKKVIAFRGTGSLNYFKAVIHGARLDPYYCGYNNGGVITNWETLFKADTLEKKANFYASACKRGVETELPPYNYGDSSIKWISKSANDRTGYEWLNDSSRIASARAVWESAKNKGTETFEEWISMIDTFIMKRYTPEGKWISR